MYFDPKNLKSETNNPWFKQWFNILLHTIKCACHSIRSMLRVLGTVWLYLHKHVSENDWVVSSHKLMNYNCRFVVLRNTTKSLKVEKILKSSLNLIPSPSPSVKIQIMGGKVCLRCKGKTLLGVDKKFVDITQQCFASFPQINIPTNNLNFYRRWRWWDWIQATFLIFFYFTSVVEGHFGQFW